MSFCVTYTVTKEIIEEAIIQHIMRNTGASYDSLANGEWKRYNDLGNELVVQDPRSRVHSISITVDGYQLKKK